MDEKRDKTNELILKGMSGLTVSEEFAVTHSPDMIGSQLVNVKTAKDVLLLNRNINPTIGKLRKDNGNNYIEAFLEIWIKDLGEFVNVKRKMTPTQMNTTAKLIIEEFSMLTVGDIKVVFTGVKKGLYANEQGSTLYQSIDGMEVLSWFQQYYNERCEVAGELSRNEHYLRMKDEEKAEISDAGKKYISKMLTRLQRKEKEKREDFETTKPEKRKKQPVEVLISIATDIRSEILTTPEQIVNNYGIGIEVAKDCFNYFESHIGKMGIIEAKMNPKDAEFKKFFERVKDHLVK